MVLMLKLRRMCNSANPPSQPPPSQGKEQIEILLKIADPLPTSPFAGGGADRDSTQHSCPLPASPFAGGGADRDSAQHN